MSRKGVSAPKSDFFHSSIEVVDDRSSRGRYLRAHDKIEAGTLVCTSSGLLTVPYVPAQVTRIFWTLQILLGLSPDLSHLYPRDLKDLPTDRLSENDRLVATNATSFLRPFVMLYLRSKFNAFSDGIFPLASYLNHSCMPNCDYRRENGKMIITAIEDIDKGEEVSISYFGSVVWSQEKRQKYLAERYLFDCACRRCSSPTDKERSLTALICPACSKGVHYRAASGALYMPCTSCKHVPDSVKLNGQLRRFSAALEKAKKLSNSWSLTRKGIACQRLESLAEEAQLVLHPCHELLFEIKSNTMVLAQFLVECGYKEKQYPGVNGLRQCLVTSATDVLKVASLYLPRYSRVTCDVRRSLAYGYKTLMEWDKSAPDRTIKEKIQQCQSQAEACDTVHGIVTSRSPVSKATSMDFFLGMIIVLVFALLWNYMLSQKVVDANIS
mmetsp:Transcript_21851/g.36172  ORF Transcript_21851/g.36172 Transcript_21851/m.36172 type:complete len:440 (-) Transcript_21851:1171-2490(-)|eukprot:CAMPEP_0184667546 /NCGR_PEP_ID=MMETSP0308-20130426/68097_1 /TAXON_ID=38269 /ORGANISM="Gloeochaete witrockiana, Strain SAG 46.84" /LENGTH=439 /DNA_ID=CAMNT_0027112823 /DNA_START=52 /DNA_END=1371 /DNA_ORIENTATION=-